MFVNRDRLTLDALLSDPLTQLVMRSDNLTREDVAQAFDEARAGLLRSRVCAPSTRRIAAEQGIRWSGL
jgi:hypothetical protein